MDFAFLKPQTSFSPVPKDHGSLTLKEFVTESFSPPLISLRYRRKMVHRKHTYTCYYNLCKKIIGVIPVIGLFLPKIYSKIMCSPNLYRTKIKQFLMEVNLIMKSKEGYFTFFIL